MNKPSGKISPEENHKVFDMLGERRQSLSTAVVQLFIANNTTPRSWQLVVTGVACFVKDSIRRGFYIQVSLGSFLAELLFGVKVHLNSVSLKHYHVHSKLYPNILISGFRHG